MIWSLVETIVANTALAGILAIPAWFVGRRTRYQALAHLLWLIVLVKLLTPPLVPLRIPAPAFASSWLAPAPVAANPPVKAPATENAAARNSVVPKPARTTTTNSKASTKHPGRERRAAVSEPVEPAPSSLSILATNLQSAGKAVLKWFASLRPIEWFVLLLGIGTAVWFARQIAALRRFARMLSNGRLPSDDVIDLAREAADLFRCEKLPRIRVLDLPITPMLWGLGPWTTLLMPARLDHHISRESLKSLVAHELAHYIRGDSWVRLAEFVATGLLWWNPLVWLARYELERSEEQCCDAMVVAHSGTRPRTYAQAILDAIDYVCESPMPLPPVASGLATAKFLEHRITMIMKRGVDGTLAKWGRAAVGLSLLVMLPWTPRLIAASKSEIAPPAPPAMKSPQQAVVKPTVKVTVIPSIEVKPDAPDLSSSSSLSPTYEWTGAPLRPDIRSDEPWARIEAPIGDLAVEISKQGELRWASPSFSLTQPPFTSRGILAVVWSHDGNHVFTAGDDGYVRAWKAGTSEEILAEGISSQPLTTLDLSSDGVHLAIGNRQGRLWILNSEKGYLRQLSRDGDAIASVRYSPDGKQLVVTRGAWSSIRPTLEVVDVNSSRVTRQIPLTQPAATAEWTYDSKFLAVASWGGMVEYYDPDGEFVGAIQLEKGSVAAWALSSTASGLGETGPAPADLEFGADTFDGLVSEGIAPSPTFNAPSTEPSFLDWLLNPRSGN